MRFYERQPKETAKSFEAFKIFRDMGAGRTLKKTTQAYYGSAANLRWVQEWSRKHDWVERVAAYDAYMEMIRRDAVEQHDTKQQADIARREQAQRVELLEVKEILLPKLKTMARWPIERKVVKQGEGDAEQEVHIHPARWSFHTLVKAIETLDDTPDKISFTDPTGMREYGQGESELRELFESLVSEVDEVDEVDGGTAAGDAT